MHQSDMPVKSLLVLFGSCSTIPELNESRIDIGSASYPKLVKQNAHLNNLQNLRTCQLYSTQVQIKTPRLEDTAKTLPMRL